MRGGRHTTKAVQVKPDSTLKDYWRQKEIFADLFNAYLYDGQEIIKAEELEELDADASGNREISGKQHSVKGARDVVRLAKTYHGVEYAILAIENQEGIHYAMPIRTMGYDHYSYNKQYKETVKKHKMSAEKLYGDEFLSGIKKTDRFKPVITLVLYYGERPWDGPKCLHDMLNMPKELKPFVNDYRLYLVEMRKNDLNLHNQNNRDFFTIMSILYDLTKTVAECEQALVEYQSKHALDDTVVHAIESTIGKKVFEDDDFKEGGKQMITILERCKDEGIIQGKIEGKLEGEIKTKLSLIAKKLQKGKSVEQIADELEENAETIQNIIDVAMEFAPEYDVEAIYEKLQLETMETVS